MLNLRNSLAALIVVASALFVIGVSVERGRHDEGSAQVESAAESGGEGDEAILGVDLESTPFIILAAVASLALAAAAWLRPDSESLLL